MTVVLSPAQEERVQAVVAEPTQAALIADETGYGKTYVALASAKRAEANTVLVIAPLNTFDGWTKSVGAIWPGMPVREILAADKENKVYNQLKNGERGVYLIGREFLHIAGIDSYEKLTQKERKNRRPKLIRKARWRWTQANKNIDVVVFDEVHAASNRDSMTLKALKTLKPKRLKMAMSATPGGNRFEGLWAITRWLWPEAVDPKTEELYVDTSFWRWAAKWAEIAFDPFSGSGKKLLGESQPGAFVGSLPCYFRAESEKLPTNTYRVKAALTPKQARQYNEMMVDAIAWLEDNPLVADLPMVKKIRLRQMLLGEVAFNDEGEVDFAEDMASHKAELVEKILEREGPETPILLLTDSRRYAMRLTERLQKQGHKAEAWTGVQTKNQRAKTKERFIAGETKYIVATISRAFAEGTDGLQEVCSTEVWLNKSFNSIMNEQVAGRLNRRGQKAEAITRYELYVPDSADAEDWDRDARNTIQRQAELTA